MSCDMSLPFQSKAAQCLNATSKASLAILPSQCLDAQGADLYSVTCLYAIYLANWLPLANHNRQWACLSASLLSAVSNIPYCHWESLTVVRQSSFGSPTHGLLIWVHPSNSDHELFELSPWVRPLDSLSWATFFSYWGKLPQESTWGLRKLRRERSRAVTC